ncbi:MAG TPA: hypothetical protein VHA77_04375 [Xanthobacteraceae bacterium]|nr:hypothetical protein [Xanthobacteraceae bacterium]
MRREGPAKVCGDHCRTWVSAVGSITPDTPRDFQAFARRHDLRGATIAFDSDGGSVLGALALGREVRRLDMTSTVGRTVDVTSPASDRRAKLDPKVDCESMCVFLVLAGSRRYVPPEARLRVHQIWLGDRRGDATSASYSARDLMVVQRDIGRIVQYTSEMGGSADLIEMALRIPPWEPMHTLTRDEVRQMGLATVNQAFATSVPEPQTASGPSPNSASASASVTNAAAARGWAVSERGWTLIDKSGEPILARRHLLTNEGDDIGNFDLMLGCGGSADEYILTYMEVRDRREGEAALKPLRTVTVSAGGQTRTLAIASSELSGTPQRLLSVARARIPATMMDVLGDPGDHSVLVSTRSTDDAETTIRVGNAGVAQHLPELGAACAASARPRDVRAELKAVPNAR